MASLLNLDIHDGFSLQVGLFSNVQNTASLRKRVISGELLGALISPKIVAGQMHLQVAAMKAALDASRGHMKTKTIHTELIYNLSSGKSISKALQVCAAADEDVWILAAVFRRKESETASEVASEASLFEAVDGDLVDFPRALADVTDSQKIRALFDIHDAELAFSSLDDCVVTRMAVKDST